MAIVPLSGETSPRRSENKVDLPAPLGPTNPIRSPRLTWSDTSSKSARPAKDFESCETVSIAESAKCSLVQRPAQPLNHEWTPMNTNPKMICLCLGSACVSHAGCGVPGATKFAKHTHHRFCWNGLTRCEISNK